MKKRMLSLLLSVLLALTVLAPLAATVQAASTPSIIIFYSGGAGKIIAGSDNTYNFGASTGISANADPKAKVLYLLLDGYNGSGVWIDAPSGWNTFLKINGSNKLTVQAPQTSYGINNYCALGSNRDLSIYALSSNASLTITSAFTGTLSANLYGIQAPYIDVNGLSRGLGDPRLKLTIDFNLKLGGYSTKEVYPFKLTASNQRVSVYNTDLTLTRISDYSTVNPENTPIDLIGATFLNSKTSNSAGTGHYGYHTLNYTADFTGVAHFETTNGSYYGGPYAQETYGKAGMSAFNGYRYYTKLGNVEYYHVVAGNSTIARKMGKEDMRKIYSFPMDNGYKMPSSLDSSDYVASVKWNKVVDNSTGADVTDTTAEYGVEYMATVTVVPKGLNYFTLDDSLACPPRASMAKLTVNINAYYMQSCMVFFYPVVKPDTKITLQPKDVNGYGTNTTGTFTVDTDDESASYQWQYLNGPTGTWIDLADNFLHGNTTIIGSKAKKLIVNFGALGVTLRYIRCKITGTVDGAAGVLYSDIVKYEYIQTTFKKIVIQNLDEPRAGKALDTSATTWTDAVTVSQVYYTKNSQKVTSVAAGDTVHIVVDLKLNSAYTLDTKSSVAVWNDITCLKAYSGGTAYFLSVGANTYRCEFEYTVPRFIKDITIKNVRQPYQYVGFVTELPNITPVGSHCYTGWRYGWYDNIRGATGSSVRVGNVYYYYLQLGADEGYRFPQEFEDINVTLLGLAGEELEPDDLYIEELRSRERTDDTICMWVGFACTEAHHRKGNSITNMDVPKAGKPLDTDITFESGNAKLEFVKHAVNGKMVTDYGKEVPKAGDKIDIYVGVSMYYYGEIVFDPEVFCYWYQDEDDGHRNAARAGRDWSLPYGEDICVFRYEYTIPESNVVDRLAFTRVTQPSKGQKASSSALPLDFDKIKLLDDNGTWYRYDSSSNTMTVMGSSETFSPDNDYVLSFHIAVRDGFTPIKEKPACALYDIYGGKVAFYDTEILVLENNTFRVDFYVHGLAAHPSLPKSKVTQITLLDVTAPAAGAEITSADTKLAEPVKIKFTQAEPTWKHKVDGAWVDCAAGDQFEPGEEYVLVFSFNENDINSLYYMAANKEDLNVLLISPDGKEVTPDTLELTKYTIGNIGFAAKCYFTVKEDGGVMLGDVDKDTKITASDARLALRRAVDLETYPEGSYEFIACDVDKDGKVTANDARSILRAAVDLEDPTKW